MSATTQYTDFSDLYVGLQNQVRVQTGITSTTEVCPEYTAGATPGKYTSSGIFTSSS